MWQRKACNNDDNGGRKLKSLKSMKAFFSSAWHQWRQLSWRRKLSVINLSMAKNMAA
jgi:hypothetical protein